MTKKGDFFSALDKEIAEQRAIEAQILADRENASKSIEKVIDRLRPIAQEYVNKVAEHGLDGNIKRLEGELLVSFTSEKGQPYSVKFRWGGPASFAVEKSVPFDVYSGEVILGDADTYHVSKWSDNKFEEAIQAVVESWMRIRRSNIGVE